jgi:hypothetical protein
MRDKRKRAQSSIEFTIIVGVMSFIMLGAFIVIQGRTLSIHRDYMNTAMDKLGNMMRIEVMLASKAEGGYAREFILPYSVSGYNYSVNISGRNELSISMGGAEYVIFTNDNISGNISKGKNLIRHDGENITINSLEEGYSICPTGGGSDDNDCGTIDCSGWYEASANSCYNHTDITSMRCEGYYDCKDANTADCEAQGIESSAAYSCTECQYIGSGNCFGTTKGACSNNASGTACSGGTCDGLGRCIGIGTFFIKSDDGLTNLLSLDEAGNMVLKGTCTVGDCALSNTLDAFVLRSSLDNSIVAYVNSSGNLCVENGNCVGKGSCTVTDSTTLPFINSSNTVVALISDNGELCVRGNIIQNSDP